MKKIKKSNLSEISVDVVEFMFIKWLVRQGILPTYKANCERFRTCHRTLQDDLRVRIRKIRRSPVFTFDDLIALSFPFSMTSEGTDFWVKQSTAWRHFYYNFKSEF